MVLVMLFVISLYTFHIFDVYTSCKINEVVSVINVTKFYNYVGTSHSAKQTTPTM
jgi:hypothetical protein